MTIDKFETLSIEVEKKIFLSEISGNILETSLTCKEKEYKSTKKELLEYVEKYSNSLKEFLEEEEELYKEVMRNQVKSKTKTL